jgi:pantetheine-phosphate adenylyltransferase
MTDALYPGTFDPITRGHLDILERAVEVFGTVTVAVSEDPPKTTLLTARERQVLVRRAVENIDNVSVSTFEGLLVDYARQSGAGVLIRGLRQSGDFEHEYQMAVANRKMYPELETVCLFTASRFNFISSTIVREIYQHGGDLSAFVPESVEKILRQRRETGKID